MSKFAVGSTGRLSRLPESVEVDYEDEYVYDYEYDYSEEEDEESHHNKPVPIWLSILLVVGYIFGGAFLFSGIFSYWPTTYASLCCGCILHL